jgi:hypothetical protein
VAECGEVPYRTSSLHWGPVEVVQCMDSSHKRDYIAALARELVKYIAGYHMMLELLDPTELSKLHLLALLVPLPVDGGLGSCRGSCLGGFG